MLSSQILGLPFTVFFLVRALRRTHTRILHTRACISLTPVGIIQKYVSVCVLNLQSRHGGIFMVKI